MNEVVEHEWELNKENIIPLKSGRRLADIHSAIHNDNTQVKLKIADYEMQLRTKEDGELLAIWSDYICWTEQRNISSSQEALTLMKRCVKHFKDRLEFKDNEKYVRIWIRIGELSSDPSDVYKYMFDQDIGTRLAIFYIAWATHSEIAGVDWNETDQIYEQGEKKLATPIDMLEGKHTEFIRRLVKKPPAEKKDDEDEEEEEDKNPKHRSAIRSLPTTKLGRVSCERRENIKDIASSQSRASINTSAQSSQNSRGNIPAKFEIFEENSSPTQFADSLSNHPKGSRKELPFYKQKDKENKGKLEKIVGTKFTVKKPSTPLTPAHQSPFDIFQDNEDSEFSFNVDVPLSITNRKPLLSITAEVANNTEADMDFIEEDTKNSKTVRKYCYERVYMGLNEFSLEELKAEIPRYKLKGKTL